MNLLALNPDVVNMLESNFPGHGLELLNAFDSVFNFGFIFGVAICLILLFLYTLFSDVLFDKFYCRVKSIDSVYASLCAERDQIEVHKTELMHRFVQHAYERRKKNQDDQ
jgi:hypothetical protein